VGAVALGKTESLPDLGIKIGYLWQHH